MQDAIREIEVHTVLRGGLAQRLVAEAAKRAVEPVDLLADIVELVLGENLVDAILDDR